MVMKKSFCSKVVSVVLAFAVVFTTISLFLPNEALGAFTVYGAKNKGYKYSLPHGFLITLPSNAQISTQRGSALFF